MITKRKRKPEVKVGKVTGTVRLSRKEMERTRMDVYFAAQGYCQMRGILLAEIIARDDMTPEHKVGSFGQDQAELLGMGINGTWSRCPPENEAEWWRRAIQQNLELSSLSPRG